MAGWDLLDDNEVKSWDYAWGGVRLSPLTGRRPVAATLGAEL
jgi:hypothetical protein